MSDFYFQKKLAPVTGIAPIVQPHRFAASGTLGSMALRIAPGFQKKLAPVGAIDTPTCGL